MRIGYDVCRGEKFCFKVNDFVSIYGTNERALEIAALIEPTAVAYHALIVRSGGFRPGSYVAVSGCGPVGLAAVALASVSGAAKVIAIDLSSERLETAKKMGADLTLNPVELQKENRTVADAVMEATNGVGAMVHVEATEKLNKTVPDDMRKIQTGRRL